MSSFKFLLWYLLLVMLDKGGSESSSNKKCVKHEELEKLVVGNNSRSVMYIMYHNDSVGIAEHKAKMFAKCKESWMKPVEIRQNTQYFETMMYSEFLPERISEWEPMDFVIVGTYKVVHGIQLHAGINYTLSLDEIYNKLLLARDYRGLSKGKPAEIIPFLRGKSKLLPMAEYFHTTNFTRAWYGLLEALKYTPKDIRYFSDIKPFYRNVYIIKPWLLKKLMYFMQDAMNMVANNATVRSYMEVDAKYEGGKTEVALRVFNSTKYQLHPFIFERLPSFYLRSISAMVCQTQRGPCACNY